MTEIDRYIETFLSGHKNEQFKKDIRKYKNKLIYISYLPEKLNYKYKFSQKFIGAKYNKDYISLIFIENGGSIFIVAYENKLNLKNLIRKEKLKRINVLLQ